jgi:hypothetical protein
MASSGNFYQCTELGCNKKYKTTPKLIDHVLVVHKKEITENDIGQAIEIVKSSNGQNNKKALDKQKDQRVAKEEALKEAREKERLQQQIKEENAARIRELEEAELKHKEELAKLNENWLQLLKDIATGVRDKPEEDNMCLICAVTEIDAVVVPCGHSYFCHGCLMDYKEKFGNRGCPNCRGPMREVIKVFR